jgi:hypothetical protein
MKNLALQHPRFRAPEPWTFRKAEPLADGRVLSDQELAAAFAAIHPRRSFDLYQRFIEARDRLRSEFGASMDIVRHEGSGLRVAARLEFLTTDRSIDEDLHHTVAGMGFDLILRSKPVLEGPSEERYERLERKKPDGSVVAYYEPRMLRTYVVSEGRCGPSEFSKAARAAEDLLRLAAMLRPAGIAEDLPENVIPLPATKASKSHSSERATAMQPQAATAAG